MPYLPVDLDGKRRAEWVADSLGLPRATVVYGLLQLWEFVWREKRDVPSPLYLGACLGPDERLHRALVEAGFLESTEAGLRVRGAGKWLLGMEGRSRGGHAAKANLIPGSRQKSRQGSSRDSAESRLSASSGSLGSSRDPAETQPRPPLGSLSALTPSTQHPAPIEATEEACVRKKPRTLSTSSTAGPENLELVPQEPAPKPAAVQVFDHWRAVMKKSAGAKLKGRRLKAVEARLEDGYSVEDLCRAVDGCAVTPHNCGQNDRGERYDDLELICRDVSHVDRFMANAEHPPKPKAAGGYVDSSDWSKVTRTPKGENPFERLHQEHLAARRLADAKATT